MIPVIMYEGGTTTVVYIPADCIEMSWPELYSKGLIFVEEKNESE